MSRDQTAQRARFRLVLLLVGIVGLASSAGLYLTSQKTSRTAPDMQAASQSANKVVVTTRTGAAEEPSLAPSTIGKTGVAIVDTTISGDMPLAEVEDSTKDLTAASKNVTLPSKRKKAHNSHKMLATKFPAPPINLNSTSAAPALAKGQVEMWKGSNRSFVSVAPGTKFDEETAPTY